MLEGADINLLSEWQEFYDLAPFGERRDDLRAATICLTIMNAITNGKKKSGGFFKLEDFMPNFDKPAAKPELTPEAAQSILKERYGNRRKP